MSDGNSWIAYGVLAVEGIGLIYGICYLFWFALLGWRMGDRRKIVVTVVSYLLLLGSCVVWYWAWATFGEMSSNSLKALSALGIALCVGAMLLARIAVRRTAISIVIIALILALNWIGSVTAY